MAIGGALRAALKAGDFVQAAVQSRRAARALSELNASGGFGGPGRGADDYLRGRGVDVDAMTAPGTGNPYMDFISEGNPRFYEGYDSFADSPFGGVVYNQPTPGSRFRLSGSATDYNMPGNALRGSFPSRTINAPYEGMRAWPESFDSRPGPWMGSGIPPAYHSSPAGQGFDSIYTPSRSWEDHYFNLPRAFGGRYNGFLG